MNSKDSKIFKKTYAGISKNLNKKKWNCIIDSCNEKSINSHLLQQNGILNTIAEDFHVIEVKPIDAFKWSEKQLPLDFKKVSVKKAMSLDLFCNKCDSEIFREVETVPVDFSKSSNHILLSYRVVCAEIRKKEHNMELYSRLINSNSLIGIIDPDKLRLSIKGNDSGIESLKFYQTAFEEGIKNENSEFDFVVYKYPLIKVYCSAAFSPFETYRTPFEDEILKYIFIHVIPDEEELNIIIGYHKKHSKKYLLDYISSWEDLSMLELGEKLTDLFATKIENWGLSPSLYNEINKTTLSDFIKHFANNSNNYLMNQKIDFNLFENDNYGTQQKLNLMGADEALESLV